MRKLIFLTSVAILFMLPVSMALAMTTASPPTAINGNEIPMVIANPSATTEKVAFVLKIEIPADANVFQTADRTPATPAISLGTHQNVINNSVNGAKNMEENLANSELMSINHTAGFQVKSVPTNTVDIDTAHSRDVDNTEIMLDNHQIPSFAAINRFTISTDAATIYFTDMVTVMAQILEGRAYAKDIVRAAVVDNTFLTAPWIQSLEGRAYAKDLVRADVVNNTFMDAAAGNTGIDVMKTMPGNTPIYIDVTMTRPATTPSGIAGGGLVALNLA